MMNRLRFPIAGAGGLPRRLTMLVAALALGLAGLTSTARPAQADADDILRFLAGALVLGAIVHAIDDNHRPQYYGNNVLPGSCLETIRVNGRNIQAYNGHCLTRAGYDGLPAACRYDFRIHGGHVRTGFIAECMHEYGYRQGGGHYSPPPFYGHQPPYGQPPFGHGRPPYQPPHVGSYLPAHCEMHYRQQGQRIPGYWGHCLRNAGFYNLPYQCQVSSTAGDSIYNARCLRHSGFGR